MKLLLLALIFGLECVAQTTCSGSSQPMIQVWMPATSGLPGTMTPICMVALNFTIPGGSVPTIISSGTRGPEGPQGPQGLQGTPGDSTAQDFDASAAGNVLSLNTVCTIPRPCKARIGSTTYLFQTSAAVTVTQGPDDVFVYIDSTARLTVGHSGGTISCSNTCTVAENVTNFPPDSIPLWTWTASTTAWDTDGGTDFRATISIGPILNTGAGLSTTKTASSINISVEAVPTIARSQGTASGSNPCTLSDGSQGMCPWSSVGMEMWTMTLTDGTVIGPLVGLYDPTAAASNVWTAVPLNQPMVTVP